MAPPKLTMRSASDLVPYARNARTHSEQQISMIAGSIREFGFRNPVLVDGDNGIIAGHARVQAALQLGLPKVPCVDCSDMSETQRRAYILADNRLALNAGWDQELLALELTDLSELDVDLEALGFSEVELNQLLSNAGAQEGEDDCPEVQEDTVSEPNDVWMLGNHRLMCGDSTSADDVKRLLASRDIDLIVTSPPYNQKIDGFNPSGMHRDHGWVKKVARLAYADSMPERDYQEWQSQLLIIWHEFMRDGASIFYNHKNRYRYKRVVSPMQWLPGPFVWRQEIIWRRPGSVTQNARMFLPSDERIYWLYKGDDFTFNDDTEVKSWSSVWDIAPGGDQRHAVAFPVELPRRCIRAASMPDDAVYEPFAGSGTTIIAAETTGRACYAMEISPAYVDVAVRRWQEFTGEQAMRQDDGASFDDCTLRAA